MWRHKTQCDWSLWCCNILMLMSWLSPRASVTVSSLILTNTPEYWTQWVWMIVTNELLLHWSQHSPHSISHSAIPGITVSQWFKLLIQELWSADVKWWTDIIFKDTNCSLWCVWLGVIAIVKDYSWLSRDNKRRRGANTQAWQTQ